MSAWSPEEDKMLTALRQQDIAFSQIVVELARAGFPQRSRNAAIGRAGRLGLKEPRATRQYQPRVAKVKPAKPAPERRTPRQPPAFAERPVKPAWVPAPKAAEPLGGAGMSILDPALTMGHCRYPLWPNDAPRFRGERMYCAATVRTGRPYCPYHCNIAYQPLAERTRRAA